MITDLVSPWCAAGDATNPARSRAAFRTRHAALLEALRRQRTPLREALPLAGDHAILRQLALRAADPARQQLLRDALARARESGADCCEAAILLAGDGTGQPLEPIPFPEPLIVLFLDQLPDDGRAVAAIGRAAAAITRWSALDSASPLARQGRSSWDRWSAARVTPLREWIYAEGIGLHLAQYLAPDLAPHEILGLAPVVLTRLREREKKLRLLLADDLDQPGIAVVLRWLGGGGGAVAQASDGAAPPRGAGTYLAWRMVAERVERVGLREAIRMEA